MPEISLTEAVKSRVTRTTPVVAISHLQRLGSLEDGISVHHGIIVVWDEDHDGRILNMIEERFPLGSAKPLAVREHKGGVQMLWEHAGDAIHCAPDELMTEGDYWAVLNYYIDGEEVKEA